MRGEIMNLVVVFAVTLAVFLLVIVGMAVGVMMGRRQISGSCGGLANQTDAEGNNSCSLCSNPAEACTELRRRAEVAQARGQGEPLGSATSGSEPSEFASRKHD
jgi:uncharacterized protein